MLFVVVENQGLELVDYFDKQSCWTEVRIEDEYRFKQDLQWTQAILVKESAFLQKWQCPKQSANQLCQARFPHPKYPPDLKQLIALDGAAYDQERLLLQLRHGRINIQKQTLLKIRYQCSEQDDRQRQACWVSANWRSISGHQVLPEQPELNKDKRRKCQQQIASPECVEEAVRDKLHGIIKQQKI